MSQRRACRLAGQNRNTQRRPVPVTALDEQKLRRRIRELARRHVRWGRRLVYRRLRLEGWTVNHKRVQRIWREEGQQWPLPRRRKRSRPPGGKRELLRAEYPHHVWAIDFQFDQTMDGRTLKSLNVIDEYSSLCLAIRVGRRCRAAEVIDTNEELAAQALPTAHSSADGQWPVIHRQRLAGVECRERLQYGLHPTRFTMGEPIRGIVQQPVQG